MRTRIFKTSTESWGDYADLTEDIDAVCIKHAGTEAYVFINANGDIGVNIFQDGKKVTSYNDFAPRIVGEE